AGYRQAPVTGLLRQAIIGAATPGFLPPCEHFCRILSRPIDCYWIPSTPPSCLLPFMDVCRMAAITRVLICCLYIVADCRDGVVTLYSGKISHAAICCNPD